MSVPYADPGTWVPLAVLMASLLGSSHCVSMCGGLVLATAKTPVSWAAYHLGRLMGYLGLGAIAGLLGQGILGEAAFEAKWVSLAAACVLGAGFLIAGVQVWRGRVLHLSIVPQSVLSRLYRRANGSALGTGVLTAFLPCGWLHAFVLGAIATQSAVRGGIFLLLFWIGTLPALSATPWLTRRVLRPLSAHSPRVAALILLAAGIFSVGAKVVPVLLADSHASEQAGHFCHHGD